MPTLITEAVNLSATATPAKGPGRIRIKIIDAGEGSSGDYPAKTIEQAVKDKLFSAGVHMYADHPSATENFDRPERTIKDLAAVLETDAVYVAEEKAAYADAKVFPNWREVITEMADDIGVSIRASAEVDDSSGKRVITRLVEVMSVDFVTKAGRGGKIAEVLESARAATRAVEQHGVSEATANDLREWLRVALRTSTDGYSYVIDFDDSNVWFNSYEDDVERFYQQGYTLNGNTAALTGDPVEVRIETRYVPITQAAESKTPVPNPATVTENQEEANMATIDDKELADLRESASRATTAEAELAEARTKLAEAARNETRATAESIVAEAFGDVEAKATRKALINAALAAESFDAEALKADAIEAAAEYKAAHGEGNVHGVGEPAPIVTESKKTISDDDIVAALHGGK
ncbi:hypothetical protein [Arthrobacter sp. VKM Ac-2550]|uniref:hypothetical protein n=1 Tax=Crystallibacter permensis TaxID=1938888 RepID=UPI0022276424|nr:hypothetical protein [Arthrobacter sp. VKM Ac-2550]MCW2132893.1 hypothetical protein [Arthrobacter sp. VKM Ac-2550]